MQKVDLELQDKVLACIDECANEYMADQDDLAARIFLEHLASLGYKIVKDTEA